MMSKDKEEVNSSLPVDFTFYYHTISSLTKRKSSEKSLVIRIKDKSRFYEPFNKALKVYVPILYIKHLFNTCIGALDMDKRRYSKSLMIYVLHLTTTIPYLNATAPHRGSLGHDGEGSRGKITRTIVSCNGRRRGGKI